MKKVCLALLLAVACKSSSSTTSQPTTSDPAPTPAPTEPAPTPTPDPATPTPDPATPTQGSANPTPTPMTPTPNPTPTPMTPAPTPTPTPAGTGPSIGQECAPDGSCGKGLECVKYYGIAGARGPEFKSCEVKCDKKQACPSGTKCITIADGPGQVCRKPIVSR